MEVVLPGFQILFDVSDDGEGYSVRTVHGALNVLCSDGIHISYNLDEELHQSTMRVGGCCQCECAFWHREDSLFSDVFIINLKRIFLINVFLTKGLWQPQHCTNIDVHFANGPKDAFPGLGFDGIEGAAEGRIVPVQTHAQGGAQCYTYICVALR